MGIKAGGFVPMSPIGSCTPTEQLFSPGALLEYSCSRSEVRFAESAGNGHRGRPQGLPSRVKYPMRLPASCGLQVSGMYAGSAVVGRDTRHSHQTCGNYSVEASDFMRLVVFTCRIARLSAYLTSIILRFILGTIRWRISQFVSSTGTRFADSNGDASKEKRLLLRLRTPEIIHWEAYSSRLKFRNSLARGFQSLWFLSKWHARPIDALWQSAER